MSTSLLYHAFGLKGGKYISTQYINGSVIFHAEVTSSIERCLIQACYFLYSRRMTSGVTGRSLQRYPVAS